jgi:hypothetical protein
MTRKPNPPAIPELAKHHARPPHRLGNIHVDADGKINIMPTPENVAYANRVWEHWGPNLIDNAERRMKEILAAAGMPTEAGLFQRSGLYDWFRGLDKLAEYRGHEIGSEVWYAAKIVEQIAEHRTAVAKEKIGEIVDTTLHLALLIKEASIVVEHPGTFDLGLQMMVGRSQPRRDRLALLIDEALDNLGSRASAKDGLEHICATPGVEVEDDGFITWLTARGVEKTTSFKAFQNRWAARRKKRARP